MQTLKIWWEKSLHGRLGPSQKTSDNHLDVLGLEYIWKEPNRRTLEGATRIPAQVLGLIKEELGLFSRALGQNTLTIPPLVPFISAILFLSSSGLSIVTLF